MTTTDTAGGAAAAVAADTLLIDTDVHEYLHSATELLPYLPAHWRHYITDFKWDKGRVAQHSYGTPNQFHGTRGEWQLADGTMGTDPEQMRRVLFEEEHVSFAVLNGFFHLSAMRGNYEFAAALASAYNDWQIEHWLDLDPRLLGSVHVVVRDPAQAAREIDRVARHPQIVQVFLPLVADTEYGDPAFRPILEAAVRNGLALSFHHGQETKTVLGYPRYYFEWHTLAPPQGTMSQLVSLLANGVFESYPELKAVFLEAGVAWVPWLMWRLDQQYKEHRREVPWIHKLPSDQMRDNVRVATQPMGDIKTRDFLTLVEMVRAQSMFVFASDFPHYDADSASSVLPASGLPDDLRQRVRYRNALDTFPRIPAMVR
jgi:uncharacterized protein